MGTAEMPKLIEDYKPRERKFGFCVDCGAVLSSRRSLRCVACNAKYQKACRMMQRDVLIREGHVCKRCGGVIFPWNRSGYCAGCYGKVWENRKKYRQEYQRKPQVRYLRWPHKLACKICHKQFKPHIWQHPRWTHYCDACRAVTVPDLSAGLRWSGRGAL